MFRNSGNGCGCGNGSEILFFLVVILVVLGNCNILGGNDCC